MMNKQRVFNQICWILSVCVLMLLAQGALCEAQSLIIDHTSTDITVIPLSAIEAAKANLNIAYGHSSHGRQPAEGMTYLVEFINSNGLGTSLPQDAVRWNDWLDHPNDTVAGALNLYDYDGVQYNPHTFIPGGAIDLGNPDFHQWYVDTIAFLNDPANSHINVVVWGWCGQLDGTWWNYPNWSGWTEDWNATTQSFHVFSGVPYDLSEGNQLRNILAGMVYNPSAAEPNQSGIGRYLYQMSDLEQRYPDIKFVYMTGHLEGTGVDGELNKHNAIIREYCREYGKSLYDFADIESYDPDGVVNYMLLSGNDNCDYDSDEDGSLDRNWAIDWQNTHIQFDPNLDENNDGMADPQPDAEWFYSSSAHSQPLNANLKAYAAWHLWARLAGWDGTPGKPNNYVLWTK